MKCYPPKWWQYFFWHAWLAVTIQLGLLEPQDEIFPCQWLQQIFYAEQLLKSPKNIQCVIMGHDPVSKPSQKNKIQNMRRATGIAFHKVGNKNKSIQGMKIYGLNCDDANPKLYSEDGLFMVNMIRCIAILDETMNGNTCYDAWFVYTVKLSEYFGEMRKPFLVTSENRSNLLESVKIVYGIDSLRQLPHPSYAKKENEDKILEFLLGKVHVQYCP